ncbi:hypothetical protein EMCRGX_G003653 [Ephydatia muelleri]
MNGIQMRWHQHCWRKEALVCWLDLPAETKKIYMDMKRLLIQKLRPRAVGNLGLGTRLFPDRYPSRHLTVQMSSLVDRLDGLSVAVVARPQSSDGRPGLSSGVSSVIERATVQGTVASNR